MRHLLKLSVLFLTGLSVLLIFGITGCRDHREVRCRNGLCLCLDGDDCDMVCVSPPCEAICDQGGTQCRAECANSECTCGPGAECEFYCPSGPCHVNCDGNSFCSGECWNGSCNCANGSSCVFECVSGPCHVNCAGNNPQCDGECANGTCHCGSGSNCLFKCNDNNCNTVCSPGAACALACPNGNLGVADRCWISECAAGDVKICGDGLHTVCGMECPESE